MYNISQIICIGFNEFLKTTYIIYLYLYIVLHYDIPSPLICLKSILLIAQVFNQGGWALDCSPSDLTGFDRMLASDPTRLHPFLVSWLIMKVFKNMLHPTVSYW